MKRRFFSVMLALSMLLSLSVCVKAATRITVTIDGEQIQFEKEPQIINGRVMVPMRKMFDAVGAEISWDGETSAATAIKEARYVKFINGYDAMQLGVCADGTDSGELEYYTEKSLDSAPKIIDGTMYVPARALAETFSYNVTWDAEAERVVISTPDEADGWIYYSSWSDKGHLYKADTNGLNRQILSYNDCFSNNWSTFRFGGGYIFYSVRDNEDPENEGCLYRIKTDGTGEEKLTDKPTEILREPSDYGSCVDENGDIFFIMGDKDSFGFISSNEGEVYLYKMNMDTKELIQLVDEPVNSYRVRVYGDYIYFQYDSNSIDKAWSYFRIDKNGENLIRVTGDIAANNMYIDTENERIRFSAYRSYDTYTAALDGSDIRKAEDEEPRYEGASYYGLASITHWGDGFVIGTKENDDKYYIVDDDGNELYSMEVPEGCDIEFNSYGGRIYYQYSKD